MMLGYIIRRPELGSVLRNLSRLFSIRITFFDLSDNELGFFDITPMSGYCAQFRKNKNNDAMCRTCDRHNLLHAKKLHAPVVYLCHAGLYESVIPLYNGTSYLGALMFGQLRPPKNETYRRCLHTAQYKTEYRQLRIMSIKKIEVLAEHLKYLSEYIIIKELIRMRRLEWSEKLIDFIKKNITQPLGLTSLMNESGRSASSISLFFHKEFSQSPKQYILDRKLARAADMLAEGCPVREAAAALSFYDEYHFSKLFKKKYGYSPKMHAGIFKKKVVKKAISF